ncbi:MAG: sigma-70 family RNA polymerase sigma factor [Bacteroidales bacterium]|nr:sigma-70 family RNA polymerase sigma factor [Bacteroidales bacterium]
MKNIRTEQTNRIERTPEITMFLNDARKYKMRDEVEQRELCRKAQAGDIKARQELVNCNLMFMFSVCAKYANGNDILDLMSCATIGMYNAIDLYDESVGVVFISYAVRAIQDEIYQYQCANNLIVNKADYKVGVKAAKAREDFFKGNERYPSESEIVEMLAEQGIDAKEYQVSNTKTSSLSDIVGDDDATADECGEVARVSATDNECENTFNKEYISQRLEVCFTTLSVIERDIVERFFGIGYEYPQTVEDIAAEYNYCPERIRQIKEYALIKMRRTNNKIDKREAF